MRDAPAKARARRIVGIKVDGAAGAVIRANRVIASPKGDARNPGCGLTTAIAVWDGSSGAQVLNNLVRDFQLIGIQAHGAQDVKVKSNSVRYWHPLFGTAASRVTPANPQSTNGIRFYESAGRIARNAVSSTQGAVRWNTVTLAAFSATCGTNWKALPPVPIDTTCLPVRS